METKTRGGLFLSHTGLLDGRPQRRPMANAELVEEFLGWKRSYTKWAFERYRIWVTRFQDFVNRPPDEMGIGDYVRFTDSIRGRYAAKNVQYALNIVHNYLRFFHEQGRLGFPIFLVRVPRAHSESHHCVTDGEYERMLRQAAKREDLIGLRDVLILRMLHDTGARVGELMSLRISDLSGEGYAHIDSEKSLDKRRIFWTPPTTAALEDYLKARRSGELAGAENPEAMFLGMTRSGYTPLTTRSVARMVRAMARDAGIASHIVPHSFRHAFVHRLAKKGVPDAIIANMLGHSTSETVRDYTKLSRTEYEYFYYSEKLVA